MTYRKDNVTADASCDTTTNVFQVLQRLKDSRPDFYRLLCDDQGALRPSLLVFINGEHVRYREGLDTEVVEGDDIYIIPQISGG